MCGIAGIARSDAGPVAGEVLDRMLAEIEHRGPDQRGAHLEDGIGLGIQRLRVIDLETGDQPISNEDGSVTVVLNGEIYNFRELREELSGRGHRLRSRGDTEVIVHLYEELGDRCVERLHGMFAFALWDSRRRRLLLGRDRLGKKPLFYSARPGALSFASELRSLIADPEISRTIDLRAIDGYLRYQAVPSPLAMFEGTRKLPPGCTLSFEEGEARVERYWRLRFDDRHAAGDPRELQMRIREEIRAAVRRRMIADVPLGAFLSGGIDSSVVVAAMAEASARPVKTFSIGFSDERFSELPNARLIAERYGTDHTEHVIEPAAVSLVPKIVRHYGEPFADTSALPSFQVAELASREVTVALNGDGGDESFGGYHRYVTALRSHAIAQRIPGPLRRSVSVLAERSLERGPPTRPLNRARRLGRMLALTDAERYSRSVALFGDRQRLALYTPELERQVAPHRYDLIIDAFERASAHDLANVLLEVDIETYLPDDLLVKVDIASMAHSLETRSPLLDHELMEFAATIPGSLKVRGAEKKVVLRDALRGWIPDAILDAPKRGFAVPMIGEWLRGDLREFVADVLTDPRARGRGYFDQATVDAMLERNRAGEDRDGERIWALMMLEVWHREFVDREPVSPG